MKGYEKEKEVNKERDKQDAEIIKGLKDHVKESNKKADETTIKIDSIIRKIEK